MRVCVYSAIYGDYDDLKWQPKQSVESDFVCFTDSKTLTSTANWNVVRNNRFGELHPRMRAKYFKILGHRVFPRGRPSLRETRLFGLTRQFRPYDYTIWIDASAQIKSSRFVEEVISCVGPCGWAMFRHPERECIYDEQAFCARYLKYHDVPLHEQVESYRAEGYPAKNGLMACGVIVRSTRADLNEVNEAWWQENLRWSYQDQLSLPVILWRARRCWDPIEKHLWKNDLVRWVPHNAED